MKKILALLMTFTLLGSTSAFAQTQKVQKELPKEHQIVKGNLYLNGNKVTQIIKIESGIEETLTPEEYVLELQNGTINLDTTMSSEDIQIPLEDTQILSKDTQMVASGYTEDWYRYDRFDNGVFLASSKRKRVSTVTYNSTPNLTSTSLSTSCSDTKTFSANVESTDIPYITAGAGFVWENSSSIQEDRVLQTSSGKYGWWEFAPYENYTNGYMKRFSYLNVLESSKFVSGYSPKEMNGKLDGIYYAMEGSTSPQ